MAERKMKDEFDAIREAQALREMSDDPVITITKKSLNDKELSKLSKQDQWAIEELKRLMTEKEL